jgi:hypothetical protein
MFDGALLGRVCVRFSFHFCVLSRELLTWLFRFAPAFVHPARLNARPDAPDDAEVAVGQERGCGSYVFRVAQIWNLPYRRIAFCRPLVTPSALELADALPIENRRYGATRPSLAKPQAKFGLRREAKRYAALAAAAISKAVSRFACHRSPKLPWSATIFIDGKE